MADPAVSALNSLLRSTEIDDHDEVLRLANAAIKSSSSSSSPEVRTAQQAKVVALVKLDRYNDALRTIADGGDRLAGDCALENAYALYKTGQLDAAAQVCSNLTFGHSSSSSMRGARHVAAQVAYRAEKFAEAARGYQELLDAVAREGQPGEEGELRINMLATAAQLEWAGNGHQVAEPERQASRADMESFEAAFNAACGSMARGDYAKAEILLKRSRDLCEASEYLSEEEKQAELIPILVQASYVLTRLGKTDAAIACQSSINLADITDGSAKFVAQNNMLVLNHGENPYMTARKADTLSIPTDNTRPFECQASILRRNKQVIELQCQKFRGVRSRTASALKRESPDGPSISPAATDLGVLHAAAVSHLQTGKEALRSILPLLESRPDDIGLLLTIIQLYIQTANPQPALALLEALFRRLESATSQDHSDVRFAPGLVALAVALYRMQGRPAAIRAELARAATYWQHQTTREGGSAVSLLRHAGIELLHSQDEEDLATAGDAFALLCKQQRDRLAEAGLVASFATSDRSRTQPYLDNLTHVDKLTAGVDISSLIDAGVAVLDPAPAAGKKRTADGSVKTSAPAKKPRHSRAKLPKDYDPERQPDPERWLPLRDRSTYRPKGKKGKKRAAEATQGGPVKGEGETLELVGGAGAVKVEKVPQGSAGNKKKKKGKK